MQTVFVDVMMSKCFFLMKIKLRLVLPLLKLVYVVTQFVILAKSLFSMVSSACITQWLGVITRFAKECC